MSELPQFPGCICHDLIAEGSCGAVYSGAWQDETPVAVKVFKPQAVNSAYVKHCLDTLRGGERHPGILPVYDYDLDGSPAYCVMALRLDHHDGPPAPQTLEALCGEIDEDEAWLLIGQLADAMAHAHALGIVHCGLKTSNVLLDEEGGHIRLQVSDFGQGWLGGVGRLALNDHTFYASPEQLAHPEQLFEAAGLSWDVYAFGAVAFRLLTGLFPRFETELEQLRQRIEEDRDAPVVFDPVEYADNAARYPVIEWPEPTTDPAETDRRLIIERCLALAPEDRFSDIGAVRDALAAAAPLAPTAEVAPLGETEQDSIAAADSPAPGTMPALATPDASIHITEEPEGADRWSGLSRFLPWVLVAILAVVAGALYTSHSKISKDLAEAERKLASEQGAIAKYSDELDDIAARKQENDSLVAESTLEAGAAREEKLRAQRNLAKAQDTADYFFTEFVNSSSEETETPERKIAFERAERFYQSVLTAAEGDQDLLDSVARATLNLALIQSALGKTDAAEVGYNRAIESITQLVEQDPDGPAADDQRLRLARARLAAAKLRLSRGEFEQGLTLLEQSADEYRPFASRLASEPALKRTVAEVYHLTGGVLRELDRVDEAVAQQGRAIELLSDAENNPNSAPNDALLLSKAYFERGRCHLAKSEFDQGANDHVKAVDILLELTDLDPEAPSYRYQLGNNYRALGEMLAASGIWDEAGRAHTKAVEYLNTLVKQSPNTSIYKIALARDYAAVARLVRDQGSPEKALDYQRGTVVFINEVVTKAGATDLDRHELALNRGLYAELLAIAKKLPDAVNEAEQAVTMIEEIKIKQAAGSYLKTKFQISLAQLYGTLGDVSEQSENKDEAIASFKQAVETWQQLLAAGNESEVVVKGLEWCLQRLAALDLDSLEGKSEEGDTTTDDSDEA